MKIDIEITDLPLAGEGTNCADGTSGAVVEFAGVVRAKEGERVIDGLQYEAYDAMARSEMERILRDLEKQFPCHSVEVKHRKARVPVGEAAIVVRVAAKHRAEAFGMLAAFMDRLKQDVPIWKLQS
ncbi:MAG: molybdopterin synthase catalytic subunit [Chthoniobacterales bacterium]